MFHPELRETTHVNPNVRYMLHVGTELDVARQEVEVPGTHLARLPTARFLRSKGDQKMSSNTPSWQNHLRTVLSGRLFEAAQCFATVALFGVICLMYPQIQGSTDSSRRTSSPPPPPCTLPPSWGPEMEPRYPFSAWVRDVRSWEELESLICAQRRAHKVFAQLTTSAKELAQDIPLSLIHI